MQLTFDDAGAPAQQKPGPKFRRETFDQFHRSNPQVYREFVRLAREAKGSGRKRIGMRMLFEVVRWHFFLRTKAADDFKINNNHCAAYARLIMKRERDLVDIFETRTAKADNQ